MTTENNTAEKLCTQKHIEYENVTVIIKSSIYNNSSVNLATGMAYVDKRTSEGWVASAGTGDGRRQTTCAPVAGAGERRGGGTACRFTGSHNRA